MEVNRRSAPWIFPSKVMIFILAVVGFVTSADAAVADIQYGAYGNAGWTYQHTWASECKWYDEEHDWDPPYGCMQAVHSNQWAPNGDTVAVNQYGRRHAFSSNPSGCNMGYFEFEVPDPKTATATTKAYVNQYFCGETSCQVEVNVIGFARHYDLTMDPYTWFTTSDGYNNWIDPTVGY